MQQLFTIVARFLRDESGVISPGSALAHVGGMVEVTFKDFSELGPVAEAGRYSSWRSDFGASSRNQPSSSPAS